MKVTDNDVCYALIKTFLEYCDITDMAELSVMSLKRDGHGVELDDSNDYGFTMRAISDGRIDDDDISSALIYAVRELFEQGSDDMTEYMNDKFDIAYDPGDIDEEFVQTYFDWSRTGRLITVELDL